MCEQKIEISCEEFLAGKRNDLTLEQLARGVIAIASECERYRLKLNKLENPKTDGEVSFDYESWELSSREDNLIHENKSTEEVE